MGNLPLTFDCMYCSQKLGEDFAKFCGLLRMYELYKKKRRMGLHKGFANFFFPLKFSLQMF